MNLLNKLTIKNLKLNKKRTIVTIIGIMLSVALITAVASMYTSGINSIIHYETQIQGNYHAQFCNVSADDISYFKNNRKIELISITKEIGYAKINSKNDSKPYAYVKAYTNTALNNLAVRLTEGRLPENENEILIPTHLKTNGRVTINVGDTITLDIGERVLNGEKLNQNDPLNESENISEIENIEDLEKLVEKTTNKSEDEQLVNTNSKTYTVVGIAKRPATSIEPYSAPGYTFITYANDNDLTGDIDIFAKYTKEGVQEAYKITANILDVDETLFEKLENTESAELLTVEEEKTISKQLENSKYKLGKTNSYLIGLQTNPIGTTGIRGLGAVCVIIMAIIVVTSVFCIKNSFDISITEKIKQYGMLRSIGATKKLIKKNVFYEGAILGTIGIPLGILLGFSASSILIIVSNHFLKGTFNEMVKLEFSFSWIACLVAITLGVITIYLSAFRSARKAAKVSPIDSIRNSGNIKINSKKIKSPKLVKRIFGIGGEISYKNLKRNKKKYKTTIISIIISVEVFIALSSFMSLALRTANAELTTYDYDVKISFEISENNENEIDKKILELTNLENIKDYSVIRNGNIVSKDVKYNEEYTKILGWTDKEKEEFERTRYMSVIAIGKEQYQKYIKSLGLNYDDIKDKGILMDTQKVVRYNGDEKETAKYKYMRVNDVKKGDTIIGKIYDSELGIGVDTKNTFESLKDIEIQIGCVTEEEPLGIKNEYGSYIVVSDQYFNEQQVKISSYNISYKAINAEELQDSIEGAMQGTDINYNLINVKENVEKVTNLYILIGIFLYGFIIVISLIGITNIFNTITTNMELRKPEFAMLKSIGMTNKEFSKMIRLESLFMGTKALIFGTAIGLILSYIIYQTLGEEMGFSYQAPYQAIIISIFAVFILISIIMKYSKAKINKQNTIETIRNENI